MLKLVYFTIAAYAVSASPASFKLNDPAILGRYTLAPANKQSSIQTAELRFDADQALSLFISHTGDSYTVEKIDQNDVIVSGDADCQEDQEECEGNDSEDDVVKVRLVKSDQGRPRLIVDVTWSDTLDGDGKGGETVTYILDWTAAIPNAVSFYQNMDNPAPLQAVFDACTAAVSSAFGDTSSISESDVCPSMSSIKYRTTAEDAMLWYLKEVDKANAKGTKEISVTDFKNVLAKEESYFAHLPRTELRLAPDRVAATFRKYSDWIVKNSDRVFAHVDGELQSFYVVNSKDHVISIFTLPQRESN